MFTSVLIARLALPAAERTHLEDLLDVKGSELENTSEDVELIPSKAPASGRVLEKNITPGQTVSPLTDTFVIGDLSHLWMLAPVGAATRAQLHVGQSATVTIPDVPGATYAGRVMNLGMEFEATTRLARVRIDIEHPDGKLRPQMLANAEFQMGGVAAILVSQELAAIEATPDCLANGKPRSRAPSLTPGCMQDCGRSN